MKARKSVPAILTIVAYIVTTFAVQGTSHFVLNADHYAVIPFMRPEPIIPMGVASMIVQGTVFALLFPVFHRGRPTVGRALLLSWALGAFLASYIVLGEAGKYAVPSIASWIGVEAGVAAAQFTVFGILLGLLHRGTGTVPQTSEGGHP
jgi:hypothetical protein